MLPISEGLCVAVCAFTQKKCVARLIQRVFRGHSARAVLYNQREASIKIQALARRVPKRAAFLVAIRAAVKLQVRHANMHSPLQHTLSSTVYVFFVCLCRPLSEG